MSVTDGRTDTPVAKSRYTVVARQKILNTTDCNANKDVWFALQVPRSADDWRAVAEAFYDRWNFPNCIGAVDGKHVVVLKPAKSGSTFLNYKQTFSVVLMAIVDANYKFLYVNVGAQGRISDAGVSNQCNFSEALQLDTLDLQSHV